MLPTAAELASQRGWKDSPTSFTNTPAPIAAKPDSQREWVNGRSLHVEQMRIQDEAKKEEQRLKEEIQQHSIREHEREMGR
jgi:hypothetical protein